jgi:hypothetical protein
MFSSSQDNGWLCDLTHFRENGRKFSLVPTKVRDLFHDRDRDLCPCLWGGYGLCLHDD